jgi:hypothetical protein
MEDAKTLSITQHAAARMQQRGISMREVTCLHRFGRTLHDNQGCVRRYLDRKRLAQIRSALPEARAEWLDRVRDLYLVEEGNCVITVGHRTRKLRR